MYYNQLNVTSVGIGALEALELVLLYRRPVVAFLTIT